MSAGPPLERRQADRRRGDRRAGDRRRGRREPAEDSWFGALADAGQTTLLPEPAAQGGSADADAEGGSESRFLAREARRIVSGEGTALQRVFRAYVLARAVLGTALVLTPWVMRLMGAPLSVLTLLACLGYASQAISLWLLGERRDTPSAPSRRLVRRQWVMTIGVDLLVFSLLHLADPRAQLNYAALLALPVLMAGVMTKRLAALATAAFVALVLLVGVWRSAQAGSFTVALLSQAGLAGMGAFVITLLSGELAQRLAREERAARGSLELARQQARLNRLVLDEMADGVLVVDRRCRVRAANPSARQMLGRGPEDGPTSFDLHDEPAWQALLAAVEQAYGLGHWPEGQRELKLPQPAGAARTVQVRARFTRRGGIDAESTPPEEICVLFLEDVRSVQARVRQEKLAAMGRVSAGIAHEIRNPLAAIAQANALLLEDQLPPTQQKLARIVEDNVERLKRIVDDVMAVAPGGPLQQQVIDASAEVARICAEWLRTSGLAADVAAQRLDLQRPDAVLPVLFDTEHLRRVLVNLLDNARRHGSETAGAVQVRLVPSPQGSGAVLTVASDGDAIAPDVERHLFEPFFSTRSRGTGLGLYICRELCERHRASIEYRPGAPGERHRNVFRVMMRGAPAAA